MASVRLLPDVLSEILGLKEYGMLGDAVGGLLGGVLVVTFLLMNAALVIWAKRKITAAFTDRIAINRVGPFGLLIIVTDAVRLMSKELVVPDGVDRPAYDIAPLVIPFSALLGFAVIPMGHVFGIRLQLADPEIGVVYLFAVASLATLGLTMAGYASNNKYAFLGGLRAIAQNIAYEIPLVVTAASVVLFVGSLQTSEIVAAQQEALFTIAGFTIPAWFAFVNPFAFVLFLAANLAEVGRNPFDIPEAPTELVAGYQTEYSSIYWTLMYMGEFLHMFLGGAIVTTLFLGGPSGPILPGFIWFVIKMWTFFLFVQWARSALPRLRIDQLIEIGWKGMLVLSFANLVLSAVILAVVI